jgi:two-component system OmpR family response regulator
MISALGDVDERIAGLRAGGDDYLIKPFAPDEMAMRVEVLLRRQRQMSAATALLVAGPVEIDLIAREVRVDGTPVRLLHMEFRLLEFLVRNAGETMPRQIIFERVWGYYFDPGANLIAVHIARLRKKIDIVPGRSSLIETVKGEGIASMAAEPACLGTGPSFGGQQDQHVPPDGDVRHGRGHWGCCWPCCWSTA